MVVAGYAPSGYGWGAPTHETGKLLKFRIMLKNAQSPSRPVHYPDALSGRFVSQLSEHTPVSKEVHE